VVAPLSAASARDAGALAGDARALDSLRMQAKNDPDKALKQAASQIIQAELEGDEEPEEPAKPDLKDLPPPDYRPRQGDQDFRQEALAR